MNAFAFAFKSDKAINEYFEKEDEPEIDEDMIDTDEKLSRSLPLKTDIFKILNQDASLVNHNSSSNDTEIIINPAELELPPANEIPLDKPFRDDHPDKRTFLNKLFGPIEAGSIRGSIFNLMILSMGSGCLSLPHYIHGTSLFLSVFLVLLIGIIQWWSLKLMSKVCHKENIYIYSRIVRKWYGPCLSAFYDIIVIIYSVGVLILYFVIMFKLIGEGIYNLFLYDKYENNTDFLANSFWNHPLIKYTIPYVLFIFVVFPWCLIRDVSKLRIASLFGIFTLVSLIILLIIESFSFINYYWENKYQETKPETHLNLFNVLNGFTTELTFFQFTSSLFYSYTATIGAIPIFNTLKNNVRRRIGKVIRRTVVCDCIWFLIICIFGYLTWPLDSPALIVERNKIVKGPDIPIGIGWFALVLTIAMKLPSNYASLRISIFEMFWGHSNFSVKNNLIVTFLVWCFCCTVSIWYTEITGYIKLIGGLCSTMVGFIFPALLYTRSNKFPRWHWRNVFVIGVMVTLTSIGYISAGRTMYEIINASK